MEGSLISIKQASKEMKGMEVVRVKYTVVQHYGVCK